MEPKIAVIIPAYYANQCIGTLLKALDKQTIKNTIYIVDSGDPVELESDFPVKYQYHYLGKKNISAKRNKGIELAPDYDYYWFVDSDTEPTSDCLEKMLEHFKRDPKIGIIGGALEDNEQLKKNLWAQILYLFAWPAFSRQAKARYTNYTPSAIFLVKQSVIQVLKGFSEKILIGEDKEFVTRAIKNNFLVYFEPKAFAIHHHCRVGLDSLISKFKSTGYGATTFRLMHPQKNQWFLIPRNLFLFILLWLPFTTATTFRIMVIGLKNKIYLKSILFLPFIFFGQTLYWWGSYKAFQDFRDKETKNDQ